VNYILKLKIDMMKNMEEFGKIKERQLEKFRCIE